MSRRGEKAVNEVAKTKPRSANKVAEEYYQTAVVPANRNIDALLNRLVSHETVEVFWVGNRKLLRGVTKGTLCAVFNGGKTWRVLIDGYRHAQDFHAAFWRTEETLRSWRC